MGYFGVGTDPAVISAALAQYGVFSIEQYDPGAWVIVTQQGNSVRVECTGVYVQNAQGVWTLSVACGLFRSFNQSTVDPYNKICEHVGFSWAPLGASAPGNPTGYPGH